MKVPVNAETLVNLGTISKQNGTEVAWMDITMEWLQHYIKYNQSNDTVDRNKDKALEYCIEVYDQYTREEIHNFHGSLIRCWKVGKRAKNG